MDDTEINLSTRTEDRKEKEAGSGGWRLKEGNESTLGWEGSAQMRVSRSGVGRGSGRPLHTEGRVGAGAMGRCPRGSGQGGRRAE